MNYKFKLALQDDYLEMRDTTLCLDEYDKMSHALSHYERLNLLLTRTDSGFGLKNELDDWKSMRMINSDVFYTLFNIEAMSRCQVLRFANRDTRSSLQGKSVACVCGARILEKGAIQGLRL